MDNIMNTDTHTDTDTDTDMDMYMDTEMDTLMNSDTIMDTDIIMTVYNNITPYLNTACTGCASYANDYIFNYYVGTYMMWITLHYLSANLYSEFCTDWSIYGFILFPFTAVTPWCKSLSWIIQKGTVVLDEGYLLLGAYFSLQLMKHLPINNNKNKND